MPFGEADTEFLRKPLLRMQQEMVLVALQLTSFGCWRSVAAVWVMPSKGRVLTD